jgi:hypothetical protein
MASTKAIMTLTDRVRRKKRLIICPSILGENTSFKFIIAQIIEYPSVEGLSIFGSKVIGVDKETDFFQRIIPVGESNAGGTNS